MAAAMPDFRYKAFISYSSKDRPEAERLHRRLEGFHTPKALIETAKAPVARRLQPIFKDREEFAAGSNLRSTIESALSSSEFLVVVCSPDAAKSQWVNKEIAYFRKHRDPANVLCYISARTPSNALSVNPDEDWLPLALRFETTVAGESSGGPIDQPLAADAREGGDGERLAQLKIIAAMLRVGLDDLVRRDAQRRARNRQMIVGGSVAMSLVTSALAAAALVSRQQAIENEARAQREALKATRTTEFMVRLFEVNDPGEARGREITAKEILDRGVASIESGLTEEPEVRSTLMHTMGRVYTGLGLYSDAARLLGEARDEQLGYGADPKDVFATESAYARALYEQGELEKAEAVYARLISEADADIAHGGWRIDYAIALIGAGETALYAKTPDDAEPYYRRARDLLAAHGLAKSEEAAKAARGLAGIKMDQGDFVASEQLFKEARDTLVTLKGPDYFEVALVDNDLGNFYYFRGDFPASRDALRSGLRLFVEMLGESHPDTIIASNNVARLELETGEIAAARERMNRVVALTREVGRATHEDFAFIANNMGLADLESGDANTAIDDFREALIVASGASNRLFPEISLNLGRALCETGNADEGLRHIEAGRSALSEHYKENNWRYGLADEFESRCRSVSGDQKLASGLAATGAQKLETALGASHYFAKRAAAWAARFKA